jgi:hypothetical protein
MALVGTLALGGALAYAAIVGIVAPGARSGDATLGLTVLAFAVGVPAYAALTLLPVAARHERLARILAERWHLAIIGYAQGATVLIAFLLLATLGLA